MVKIGVRGGAELRKRTATAKKQKSGRYACPKCGKSSVKHIAHSHWKCRSCAAEFAGGAYALSTPVGQAARRIVEDAARSRTAKG